MNLCYINGNERFNERIYTQCVGVWITDWPDMRWAFAVGKQSINLIGC